LPKLHMLRGGNLSLHLDWCSHQAAKVATSRWHYSKSMPTPPILKVGVWEDDEFKGVVLFSRGANKNAYRPFGLKQTEGAELTRVALRDHQAPVSRIVAIAVRLLKQRCPGVKLIVSFADPAHGHVGTIYQAGGWLYTGATPLTHVFKDKHGRIWHRRMVANSGFKPVYGKLRRVLKRTEAERMVLPGKHRYVLPLDDEIRARVLPMVKPYPRRSSIGTDAPSDQLGMRALESDRPAPLLQGAA